MPWYATRFKDVLDVAQYWDRNYANLRKFLQAVEESDKFLVVERVSLAKGKEGGSSLSLSISLATYFTAPPELVARKRALARGRRG